MASLDDYRVFIAVVEQGNLSAAARHLQRSLQAVSRSLAALESELGVELIQRTTRRAQPSDAGLAFHARIKTALADIDLARSELADHGARIDGLLRVGGSTQFSAPYLVPVVAAFMERYPDVHVELVVADHRADLQREKLDAAVRLGELPASRLHARQLGMLRMVTIGAPGYFARHGYPRTPADLRKHACIVRRTAEPVPQRWDYRRGGRKQAVEVHGRFSADNAAACNAAAIAGLGIGVAALWQVRSLLDQRRLETVLDDWQLPGLPLHIVWSPSKQLPARTRAFIDFVAARWTVEPPG
ncbi:LysR family transcriptional regulator [Dyella nitratireducens]|uniref:LysR family transcriptional regulator n=1 Tax=Dyella nitratireducens TaxID=1849580 RepID=A0ABQ1FPE1_9GAMM|nr:LysR family transcriptional regulator [Dyella nitratireducens]GGA22964.1 LysR family transcriptional regulator [Dyella nitratireducens]GLQ44042.1 LysR family transcriptional regulator [Dyella nitratireducens]